MFGYSLSRLDHSDQINLFRDEMITAGLVVPTADFLSSANVFGLTRDKKLVGGFVHSTTPRRIFSVLGNEANSATKEQLLARGISESKVQELSSLWTQPSVGFSGRFLLIFSSVLLVLTSGTPYVVLMCKKEKLVPMYERARPVTLYREKQGMLTERVYLFSRSAALRTLAHYPFLKMQRSLRKLVLNASRPQTAP